MRNEILKSALRELKIHGIKPDVWFGGKHIRVAWEYQGSPRSFTVPISASDYRSKANNKAQLKRILRQDGLTQNRRIAS